MAEAAAGSFDSAPRHASPHQHEAAGLPYGSHTIQCLWRLRALLNQRHACAVATQVAHLRSYTVGGRVAGRLQNHKGQTDFWRQLSRCPPLSCILMALETWGMHPHAAAPLL
eukprot:5781127-Prymnesium_polylepis.1